MAFADNLQCIRKRHKITQEALADELGVSRQSVSKWETGEAYPETDKLILLCDKFGVSLDDLLRGDLTVCPPVEPQDDVSEDKGGFIRHINVFSRGIALGVFLILAGVAVCMLLAGISVKLQRYADFVSIMGGVAVLVFSAVAVFLFIYHGMMHDRFQKAHPVVSNVMRKEEREKFFRRFPAVTACFVTGILLDIVYLVVMFGLFDSGIVRGGDAAACYVTALFLFVLALAVGGLVYTGIVRSKYAVEEYNRQTQDDLHPSPRTKWKNALCGGLMLFATALYLVLGFVWNKWHPGWIVFPVGGILCGIIGTLMGNKDDGRKD